MGVNSDLVVGVHSSSHHSTSKMEGHNRVWLTGLEELGRIATVVTLDYGAATRPAAWLHNGHVSMPPFPSRLCPSSTKLVLQPMT